jgi:arylsulfatase A-like enzyme
MAPELLKVSVPWTAISGVDAAHNLPTAMRAIGYSTAHFGKWHLASDEALAALGCTVGSTEYECAYDIQQQV